MRFSSMTSISRLPTISRVGAVTCGSAAPARSGRPPRETIARTGERGAAAATSAAPAPVLAPKYPIGRCGRLRRGQAPIRGERQARGEQRDVEHVGAVAFFVGGQEVEQQRRQAGLAQRGGDPVVARAQPAAAAAMREDDQPLGVLPERRAALAGAALRMRFRYCPERPPWAPSVRVCLPRKPAPGIPVPPPGKTRRAGAIRGGPPAAVKRPADRFPLTIGGRSGADCADVQPGKSVDADKRDWR